MSGHRPFQELNESFTADRRRRIETRKRELLAEMPLHELRQALAMTQRDLADRLRVNQPAIAKLEKRTDLYISSLRSYIEAVGGQLRIVASFPTGDVGITNFSSVNAEESVQMSVVDGFADFLREEVNLNQEQAGPAGDLGRRGERLPEGQPDRIPDDGEAGFLCSRHADQAGGRQ